jgi:PHD/YefM family antitoxin component YafN of YafNO toxin-antitoxin module
MLNLTRDIHSLSNFKRETPKFLKQMKETKAPIVLTLNGMAEIVVQSATGYQALLDRLDELETREAIRVGLQEIADGKAVPAMPALTELQQRLEQEFGE